MCFAKYTHDKHSLGKMSQAHSFFWGVGPNPASPARLLVQTSNRLG
jgi:hypothetical protein